MRESIRLAVFVLACAVFLPAAAFAQGSIAGAVKDATGAVLPGCDRRGVEPGAD